MTRWREELNKALCKELAVHVPFSQQEVQGAYRICASFDILLRAIEFAEQYRMSSLDYVVGLIMEGGEHNE